MLTIGEVAERSGFSTSALRVAAKLDATQRQIAELLAFAAQLERAAAHLKRTPVDGPCAGDCACPTEPSVGHVQPVSLGRAPAEVPAIACTLDGAAAASRIEDWQRLLAHVRARMKTADGALRLEMDDHVPVEELTRLAAAEFGCCSFSAFATTVDGVALEGAVVALLVGILGWITLRRRRADQTCSATTSIRVRASLA